MTWGWLKPLGKWIAKALINAGREHVEQIIDEKRRGRPKAPKK